MAQRSGVESPGLCYFYYICYMEKCKIFGLYLLGIGIGLLIGYFMTGCKSTQKCDAYSNTELNK